MLGVMGDQGNNVPGEKKTRIWARTRAGTIVVVERPINRAVQEYAVYLRREESGDVLSQRAIGYGTEIVCPAHPLSAGDLIASEYYSWYCYWRTWEGLRDILGGVLAVGALTGLLALAVILVVFVFEDWIRIVYFVVGLLIGYWYRGHRMRLAGVDPDDINQRLRSVGLWW